LIKPLDAARQLRDWGFCVLPAPFQAKAPSVPWKDRTELPSDAELQEWFDSSALAGYWILCGKASHLVVLDCDNQAAMLWAEEKIGLAILEATPAVKTAKGVHYYFRLENGDRLEQWNLHEKDGVSLDVRSDGGGVIAPPSIHKSGLVYKWLRTPEQGWQPVPEALRAHGGAAAATDEPLVPAAARSTLAALLATPAIEGGRNEWLTKVAGHYAKQIAFRDGYSESVRLANLTLRPPLEPAELAKITGSVWRAEHRTSDEPPRTWVPDLYTDAGNARRFADSCAGQLLYLDGHGWRCYASKEGRYVASEAPVVQRALRMTKKIYGEAREAEDAKTRTKISKWGDYASSARGVKAALELAKTDPRLAAEVDDFDADPLLLNVVDGVVDLRTGDLCEHGPEYRMTKIAGSSYDAGAQAPIWAAHLERIFAGDRMMTEFFQRLCGYAITGDSGEQKLAILHGYGANGKSVTIETLRTVLGGYAETTDFKTFSVNRSSGPRNDLARLAGARFVTASETSSRQWLDESVIKQVTGGEPITARFLHREYFTYHPQFCVFLSTNHRPNIEGVDKGLWRRILLVPFEVTIEEDEQDPQLTRKLRGELPGILNWLITGCLMWQCDGIEPPVGVQLATAEYRQESDFVGRFIEQCLTPGDEIDWVLLSDVYSRYQMWAAENGYQKMSTQQLGNRLREHGVALTHDAPGSHTSRLRRYSLVRMGALFQGGELI
jgi:putative DNA primase/helicase